MILDFIKLFKMYVLFTLSILMKLIILDKRLLGCFTCDNLICTKRIIPFNLTSNKKCLQSKYQTSLIAVSPYIPDNLAYDWISPLCLNCFSNINMPMILMSNFILPWNNTTILQRWHSQKRKPEFSNRNHLPFFNHIWAYSVPQPKVKGSICFYLICKKFFTVVLGGSKLWHLQKFL
jgi:hypothetical protein